jgi:FixJ family two-component response regulator
MLEQNLKLYFKTYIMNTKLMIAIVDDDPIFQFIAKDLLNRLNLSNTRFSDGKDAIDFLYLNDKDSYYIS